VGVDGNRKGTLTVELREQDDGGLLLRQNAVLTHRFERVD